MAGGKEETYKTKRKTRIGTHVWHNKNKMDAGLPSDTRTAEKPPIYIGLAGIHVTKATTTKRRTAMPVTSEKK